jgi:hypothetical protein
MANHHLLLGYLTDYLTGKTLPDTHDERYRQKIARMLIQGKEYRKAEIEAGRELVVNAGQNRGLIRIDFCIHLQDRIAMLIKYGPGSLVTRQRPTLAASRLVAPYQIPLAVVTNGEDALILDAATGCLAASGLDHLPTRSQLLQQIQEAPFKKLSDRQLELEARIVYAYEIDGSCPCDDSVCRL